MSPVTMTKPYVGGMTSRFCQTNLMFDEYQPHYLFTSNVHIWYICL